MLVWWSIWSNRCQLIGIADRCGVNTSISSRWVLSMGLEGGRVDWIDWWWWSIMLMLESQWFKISFACIINLTNHQVEDVIVVDGSCCSGRSCNNWSWCHRKGSGWTVHLRCWVWFEFILSVIVLSISGVLFLLTVRIRILWARCVLLLFTWRRSWRRIFGGVLERCWFHRFHTYWNFVCIEKIRAAPHNKEDELPNPSKGSKSMLQRREVAHQQKIRYRNRKQLAQHVAATPHKTWGDVCGFGRFVNSDSKIYNK